MTERVDEKLYQRAKAIVVKREPKHSAYRSIRIAQQYKKMFADKYGTHYEFRECSRYLPVYKKQQFASLAKHADFDHRAENSTP